MAVPLIGISTESRSSRPGFRFSAVNRLHLRTLAELLAPAFAMRDRPSVDICGYRQ
jgi:hypothetical protein